MELDASGKIVLFFRIRNAAHQKIDGPNSLIGRVDENGRMPEPTICGRLDSLALCGGKPQKVHRRLPSGGPRAV